jgi:hypothetical protein
MYLTSEGQEKGEKWARKAIWGNVPRDLKNTIEGGVEALWGGDRCGGSVRSDTIPPLRHELGHKGTAQSRRQFFRIAATSCGTPASDVRLRATLHRAIARN